MPLRVPKPYYSIVKRQGHYEVSYFTSKNMKLLRRGYVKVPLSDSVAFEEIVAPFIKKQTGEA